VSLLEYGNRQGFLQKTELSAKYIKSLTKLIKVNKIFPVRVINVSNGNIDVSKKKILASEIEAADRAYEKNKRVFQLIKGLNLSTEVSISILYETQVWPLLKDYTHVDDAFIDIASGDYSNPCISSELLELIKKRYYKAPRTVSGKVRVSCFGPEGIDAIKRVLQAQKIKYPNIKINYTSESVYLVSAVVVPKEAKQTADTINQLMSEAVESIKKVYGGIGQIKQEASISDSSLEYQLIPHESNDENEDSDDDSGSE
jgi:translation initiation factor 2 subunit 1